MALKEQRNRDERTVEAIPSGRKRWALFLGLGLTLAVATGVMLSWLVAQVTAPLMNLTDQIADPQLRIAASKDLLQYQTDNQIKIVTTILQGIVGAALVVGGYFTYQNMKVVQKTLQVAQNNLVATEKKLDIDREGQITNRFTQAVGQLGAERKDGTSNLEVRLGGIYALERIAHDSPRDHWTIMEVLTAYVRENAPAPPNIVTGEQGTDAEQQIHERLSKLPTRLRTDIQAVLTVIGRRASYEDWPELGRLDLSRTDLARAVLSGANLERADFSGSYLEFANFEGANLKHANIHFTFLRGADLRKADLEKALVIGSDLSFVVFRETNLKGANLSTSWVDNASFDGADLQETDLRHARNLSRRQLRTTLQEGEGARITTDANDPQHILDW